MSYAAKLIMHAKTTDGSILMKELVDFPGVLIADVRSGKQFERNIVFEEMDFKTIADAVTAWRGKNGSEATGAKKESQEGHSATNAAIETTASGGAKFKVSGTSD